jgi:orotate phosphoribosyltransferase-like protein
LLSRREKEKLVLDLYNQGKTYREIAQELRISPRDIGFILRKAAVEEREEKEKECADENTQQEEEQQLSISSQAYKLFYTGKGPIDVAIELNLPEQQVTKLHKQYCKLR